MKLPKVVKRIHKSFCVAFPSAYWLAVSLVFPAALTPILFWSGYQSLPDPRDPLYYLLSAQAETLGSLFVLAFTFTLVAAQIASRYSHILLQQLLGPWALWYAIPFGVGILVPLFLLRGEFYLWSAHLSLLVASFCILSLIPFAGAVRRLLSISETMSGMREEVTTSDSQVVATDLVAKLGNITIGALNLKDYETFEQGVQEIARCADPSATSSKCRLIVGRELRRLITRTGNEPFASERLEDAIFDLGVKQPINSPSETDEEMLNEVAEAYKSVNISCLRDYEQRIMPIEEFARVVIDRGDRTVVSRLQVILYVMGERVVSEMSIEVKPAQEVMSAMGKIIQRVLNRPGIVNDDVTLVRSGILAIERLGTRGVASRRDDIKDLALHQLRRVIGNTSEVGKQVEGNARASMAVLGGLTRVTGPPLDSELLEIRVPRLVGRASG